MYMDQYPQKNTLAISKPILPSASLLLEVFEKAYRLSRTNIQTPTTLPIRTRTLIPKITHTLNRRPILIRRLPNILTRSILRTRIRLKPIITTPTRRL